MLLGRDRELDLVDALLRSALNGRGNALVIQGDAGIGKTALLAAARERASGMRVSLTQGRESESRLLFSALADLVEPMLPKLGMVPAPQAAALRGALALDAPSPGDRFAVCAATLALVGAAAQDQPLLICVDDAQWIDGPSLECLAYLARRVADLQVAVLFAMRTDETAVLLDGLPDTRLGPLSDEEAGLLSRRADPDLSDPVRTVVLRAAAGNPLGILELPHSLTAPERSGNMVPAGPLKPGDRIRAAFGSRVSRLPAAARTALVVVAAADPPDLGTVSAALRSLGVKVAALEAAESDGLTRIQDQRIQFSHPLVQSVAYHLAGPADRRRAHRALAGATTGESRAWHLAAAVVGPDEGAAAALDEVGASSMARRGYLIAAAAFERAAMLSEVGDRRAERLMQAADAAAASGRSREAAAFLDQGLTQSRDPLLSAAMEQRRAAVLVLTGLVPGTGERLQAAARRLEASHPERAATMFADAALMTSAAGDCRRTLAIAEHATGLLPADASDETRAHVLAVLSHGLSLVGRTEEARVALREVAVSAQLLPAHSPAMAPVVVALDTHAMMEDPSAARQMSLARATELRHAGALHALPYVLGVAVMSGIASGDWASLEAEALESLALAREIDQRPSLGYVLTALARLYGALGREDEARVLLAQARTVGEENHLASVISFTLAAEGFLELTLGHVMRAIAILEQLDGLVHEQGLAEPSTLAYLPDLIEAYVRAGQRPEAEAATARLSSQAEATKRRWAVGVAARCRGLLRDDHIDAEFETALGCHDGSLLFDRARTLLAYGQRLRRLRRRGDARLRLREAAVIFERLDASPWHDLARVELHAAGALTRPETAPNVLSAQEWRVALAVSRGSTNREVATELFLSPRTVESHLEHIYRKLDLRSRAQLAAYLASGQQVD